MSAHSGPADWWTDGTDAGRTHIATKGIVQSGLVLNLDAGVSASYPGSGTTWTDLSGNGRNATLTNGPTFSSNNGGAVVFDGTNDYAACGDILKFASTANLTISSWFKIQSFSNINFIVARRNPAGTRTDYSMCVTNNTTLGYMYDDSVISPTGPQYSWTVNTMSTGSWYSYCLCIQNDATVSAYFNGEFLSSKSAPHGDYVSTEFVIGRSHSVSQVAPVYFNGQITQLSIYNRILSTSEIQKNFNALRGRYGV